MFRRLDTPPSPSHRFAAGASLSPRPRGERVAKGRHGPRPAPYPELGEGDPSDPLAAGR